MPDIKVITFNVRGLRQMSKRRSVFRFAHQHYPRHLVVLQETPSSQDVAVWQAEWGAPIFFAHGLNTHECGVAVLLPRIILGVCDVKSVYSDDDGRLLILELNYRMFKILLCAVYAPTQSHGQQQVDFIRMVKDKLTTLMTGDTDLLVCGDLNIQLSNLDTQNRFRATQAIKGTVPPF